MSVWLADFDPALWGVCLRDVHSKHSAKVAAASLKAAGGILGIAEGKAAGAAPAKLAASTEAAASVTETGLLHAHFEPAHRELVAE